MNPNALREWLQLYDREMGGGMEGNSAWDEGGWTRARNQETNRGRRMIFAKQMMQGQEPQGQSPDFFSGLPQQPSMEYMQPQREPSMGRNVLAMMMRGR
jgi:hypothetical protein